jgi:hypothetical protein
VRSWDGCFFFVLSVLGGPLGLMVVSYLLVLAFGVALFLVGALLHWLAAIGRRMSSKFDGG